MFFIKNQAPLCPYHLSATIVATKRGGSGARFCPQRSEDKKFCRFSCHDGDGEGAWEIACRIGEETVIYCHAYGERHANEIVDALNHRMAKVPA